MQNQFKFAARLAMIGLAGVTISACSQSGRTSVVLVDRSGSIAAEDHAIYARSIEALAEGLGAGDRVLIAAVGDADRSAFRPLFDQRVKSVDMRLEQEDEITAARKALADAVPAILPTTPLPPARTTRIMETIAAAAQAFGPEKDDGDALVILSDGVEESPVVNLARMRTSRGGIEDQLEQARAQGLLPDLSGVRIHIVGAGGDATRIGVTGVRDFWAAYAKATGATIVQIGRLSFEPG